MARYINWTDVSNRYRDVVNIADSVDGQSSYINGAEAEVDARLGTVYTVPFANTPTLTPDIIRDLATDVTYYKVWLGKRDMEAFKKDIDSRFAAILDGTMAVVSSGGSVVDPPAVAWSDRSDYPSSFGPDDPSNWAVSSQWITDAQESRGDYSG